MHDLNRKQKLEIALEEMDAILDAHGYGIAGGVVRSKLKAELAALQPKRWPCQSIGAGENDHTSVRAFAHQVCVENVSIGNPHTLLSYPHAIEMAHEMARMAGDPVVSVRAVISQWRAFLRDAISAGHGHEDLVGRVESIIRELEAGYAG